ncbi:hypothetical protein [Mucilaginibacter lacusdianchii]|uniref:hypothetical protein n=1 Tax=Mucilaginibacter lacusdianchii TaxID=2684211 RepID=UPI00131DFDC7|nr:hypothetical protein [Mucilaginibacter sp. JXJ CY 39]
MLKQYFCYFLYGFIIFYLNLFIWGFSAGAADFRPYLTLISSVLLFAIASTYSLYNPKIAAILGSVGIVGATPFAAYIVTDSLQGKLNVFALFIIVTLALLFVLSTLFTVMTLRKYKEPSSRSTTNKYLRIILTALPLILIVWWIVGVFIIR